MPVPNSQPEPSRPELSKPTERRSYRDYADPKVEWQTFTALPPPVTKLGYPRTETETSTQSAVSTEVKVATWQKRIGAFALDFGAGLGVSYLAQGLAALVGAEAGAVDMVGFGVFFATWLVNRGYLQSRPSGQSLGKWLMSIKVVDTETEQSPGLVRSVAREGVTSLLILTESLMVPLGADALFAAFDKEKRQTIHDRAGRTQVVQSDEGFDLDQKAVQFLQEVMEGEALGELKDTLGDLAEQAKQNETINDLSVQMKQMGRQAKRTSDKTRKQVTSWVDIIRDKLDNW